MSLRVAWTLLRRALPYAARRPFFFKRSFWILALLAWLALVAGTIVAGSVLAASLLAWAVIAVALVAVGATIATGIWGWVVVSRTSDKAVAFVSLSAAKTAAARDASSNQQDALVARLRASEAITKAFDIRTLASPVTAREAKTLLDYTSARVVFFGAVRVAGGAARYDSELLIRWPGADEPTTHVREGEGAEDFGRQTQVPDRHEISVDAEQPLERLVGESFEARHADRTKGTLLVLAAHLRTGGADEQDEQAELALSEAERFREALSTQTRANLDALKAVVTAADLPSALAAMEEAGRRDSDDVALWMSATALSFYGVIAGTVPRERHLAFAQRAVRSDGDNPEARYNLAEALMGSNRLEEARAEFERAAAHEDYADRYYVHFGIGVSSYNTGDYDRALRAYQRLVELRPSGTAHLFLADTHRQLGNYAEARSEYRAALLAQPTLVGAHRGYWGEELLDAPEPAPSRLFDPAMVLLSKLGGRWNRRRRWLRPLMYRLLAVHARRHPEDSRVHYMLGAFALLQGEFALAEDRLSFALGLIENDLEALGRRAAARGLNGDFAGSKEDLVALRDAPPLPGSPVSTPGYPWPEPDSAGARLRYAVLLPFVDEPALWSYAHAAEFGTLAKAILKPGD